MELAKTLPKVWLLGVRAVGHVQGMGFAQVS
jgi:hypothetical protein